MLNFVQISRQIKKTKAYRDMILIVLFVRQLFAIVLWYQQFRLMRSCLGRKGREQSFKSISHKLRDFSHIHRQINGRKDRRTWLNRLARHTDVLYIIFIWSPTITSGCYKRWGKLNISCSEYIRQSWNVIGSFAFLIFN